MKKICLIAVVLGVAISYAQTYNLVTVAGADSLRDGSAATTALLRQPYAVTLDSAGNMYIADARANRVRKVNAAGVITTVAGSGIGGFSGDGGLATTADLDMPVSVAVDKSGNLYIADYNNNRVRKVAAATGIISTVAGNGNYRAAGYGGPALLAAVSPNHVSVDSAGNLFISDWDNDKIMKVNAATGIAELFAGATSGYAGDSGASTAAALYGPSATAIDPTGVVYICDQYNAAIRKVGLDGKITTIAGGSWGDSGDGGPASAAKLYIPDSIAIDPAGTKLYLLNLDRVRVIDLASMTINAFAGFAGADMGFAGDGGSAMTARFYMPYGLWAAANGDVYVADSGNYRVRRIRGGVIDTVAGSDVKDGGLATAAYLGNPEGAVVLSSGDIVISDTNNNRIRRVNASDAKIGTIAGTGNAGQLSGRIHYPSGIAVGPDAAVVFADYGNDRVMKISPSGSITVVAGTAKSGFSGDNSLATAAQVAGPSGIAYDKAGNLYIADMLNFRVRRVDAATGVISTFAGNGTAGGTGLGGAATQANVNPTAVTFDSAGNLYIADIKARVLKVDAASRVVTMVAGTGTAGYSGDGGQATQAKLILPTGLAFDSAGNLYIADTFWIRKVTPQGAISTIAGGLADDVTRDAGPALSVPIRPSSVFVSAANEIYVVDGGFDRIRKLVPVAVKSIAIAAGDKATGIPGDQVKLSVKAVDNGNNALAGVQVNFAVVSGTVTLLPSAAVTGSDGIATTTATFGQQTGPVVVSATASGLQPLTFNLTVNAGASANVPAIATGGVVGAGLAPAKRTVSIGGIATLYGQNLAPAGTARKVEQADLVGGKVPVVFAGTCVLVGGERAPVYFVSPGQINFQIPAAPLGVQAVRVVTGCGTSTEVTTNPDSVTIAAAAPEFFSFRAASDGRQPVAAVDAVTAAYVGGATLGAGFTPAKPKQVISVFGTNFGATNPAVNPADIPTGIAGVAGSVKVTLGGKDVPSGNVLYAGITPGNPGLYQLNLIIPDDAADGDLELILSVAGIASPSGAYLTVKR